MKINEIHKVGFTSQEDVMRLIDRCKIHPQMSYLCHYCEKLQYEKEKHEMLLARMKDMEVCKEIYELKMKNEALMNELAKWENFMRS